MGEMNKIIGENIKDARERKRISQQELARRVGTSQSRISDIEAGKSDVLTGTLYRIARSLGEDMRTLIGGNPNPVGG